ncbi:MAG: Hsp70 family protein [Rhizobiaceae bacterium]
MTPIGIDLGTTNSLIAHYDGDAPVLIPNALGKFLTPSVVSIGDDGSILTGEPARDRLLSHPELTVASFKRLMGTGQVTKLGRHQFRPEELSAVILRVLKDDAENALATKITNAVISVPAYFNETQRQATIDAAKLAGLHVERLVNEPTAAALAHGFADAEAGKYLVFDLGGGTFDVSILDRFDDVMEVIATTGNTRLGGDDFTAILENLILSDRAMAKKDLDPKSAAAIRRQAELLKIELSREHTASCSFTLGDRRVDGRIARTHFELEAAPLLGQLKGPTEMALRDSGTDPGALDAIILVGGATRMPMVRSLIARMFGRLPLINVDPDAAVALGAAVQSGLIRRKGALRDVVMTDVCPFSLGVALVDDENARDMRTSFSPLIERNAIIPISRNMIIQTVRDFQIAIEVQVFQGESLRTENNVFLGKLVVDIPRARKGVQSADVRFTYDINGVLEVEVTVLSTGKKVRQFLNNGAGLSPAELAKRFAALESHKLHPRLQMENAALLARAERLYEETREETRAEVKMLVIEFEHDISRQQLRNQAECREWFSKRLDQIETGLTGLY